MSEEPTQSFANHARMVPGFHYVTGGLTLVYLIWSLWRLVSERSAAALQGAIGAGALVGTYWYARNFPLKAQDRVIRLEEQLRLARLLPAELKVRASALTARQLISLRFASDAEVPELVEWIIANGDASGKMIKQRIRTWRPDHHRV